MNVTVLQFKRKDGKWGAKDPTTGKWNGMVSSIVNGDADLISTSLAVFGARTEVIDYLHPLTNVIRGFAIKSITAF